MQLRLSALNCWSRSSPAGLGLGAGAGRAAGLGYGGPRRPSSASEGEEAGPAAGLGLGGPPGGGPGGEGGPVGEEPSDVFAAYRNQRSHGYHAMIMRSAAGKYNNR